MARRYRMTPARRAAIKKAQEASARKRRKRRIIAGTGITVVSVTAAAAGGYYARKGINKRRYRKAHEYFVSRTPQLALPAGKTKLKRNLENSVFVDRAGNPRGRKNTIAPRKGVIKVNSQGVARSIKRNRPNYDASRRADYSPKERQLKYINSEDFLKRIGR